MNLRALAFVFLLVVAPSGGNARPIAPLPQRAQAVAVAGRLAHSTIPYVLMPRTFQELGTAALTTLNAFYQTPGRWRTCLPAICGSTYYDWGADSMTYDVWFHWKLTHDSAIAPMIGELSTAAKTYLGSCGVGCGEWSDIPMWDSISDSREYEITGSAAALSKAISAFNEVYFGSAFQRGACPTIDFQQTSTSSGNTLKTLETDSNYIKAALLLYRYTRNVTYLQQAQKKYAAVRRYFLDPAVALYTVYVLDDGTTCTQLPHRFFASVNGNMIFNGIELSARTGNVAYLNDAIATAQAVSQDLADATGTYANLQAGNDVAEPLVEAMYDLATEHAQAFARNWLLSTAARLNPTGNGSYGRFGNGPASTATSTIWQTNGGLALAMAAAALQPHGVLSPNWNNERYVADDLTSTPATITFTGHGIALVGTIGERCCESGHARVFVDGVETFDKTGIWQNKSSSNQSLPNSLLFAWRFSTGGSHTVAIEPGVYNVKEGASFFHMVGYYFIP